MASDIVPIQLSLTEGDLVTLWAPRWREDGEEWEAFLGDDDALFAFPEVAQLAAFVRTDDRARPDRPPRLVGRARPDGRRADPDDDPPLRHHRRARAGRRGRRPWTDRRAGRDHRHGPLDRRRLRARRSSPRCSTPRPGFALLHQGTLPFVGREGARLWAQLVDTIAERWDDVIDALDELVDDPATSTPARAGRGGEGGRRSSTTRRRPPVTERTPTTSTTRRRRDEDDDEAEPAFWEEVGIDPIRIITRRRRPGHAALLPRRRAGVPRLRRRDRHLPHERALARCLADDGAEGNDLAAASTWPRSSSRPASASWRSRSTRSTPTCCTGLDDDIAEGTHGRRPDPAGAGRRAAAATSATGRATTSRARRWPSRRAWAGWCRS